MCAEMKVDRNTLRCCQVLPCAQKASPGAEDKPALDCYFAKSTARVSRTTDTRICPG
jgi:hypothetical protein